MKGNNEEIVGLFRQKLGRAEMPVNDGFWEALERDLPASGIAESKRRILSPSFYRIAAAASVVLVLGMASAAFWFFSPKEEMEEAFTQVAALVPGASLDGDRLEEILPSVKEATPTTPSAGQMQPVLAASGPRRRANRRCLYVFPSASPSRCMAMQDGTSRAATMQVWEAMAIMLLRRPKTCRHKRALPHPR